MKNDLRKSGDERMLLDFASEFVLLFFQSWGQTLAKKVEMLNKAAKLAGIKAKFTQKEGKAGWLSRNAEEAKKAIAFRKEIVASFPLGQFEAAQEAIVEIIMKYRKGDK